MTIELNQSEVEMLKEALDAWEKAQSSDALISTMLTAMLCPKDARDEMVEASKKEMVDAGREGQRRKDRATLLRARLLQASARASEHEEVQHANH